jgi:hypothetical protein
MRLMTCLDRDRELAKPAPVGAVRSESTVERLARLLRQANELPAGSAAAIRWRAYCEQERRRKF